MPFARPSLTNLVDQAVAEIESSLPMASARPRRSVLGVLARVVAGAAHGLYGYQDWIARQILPDTAEDEQLDRHAALRGLMRLTSEPGTGVILVTGDSNILIPPGTEWRRADGTLYYLQGYGQTYSGSGYAWIAAKEAGAAGNCPANTTLTIVTPISGLVKTANIIAPGITTGRDTEDDDSLRARLLERWRRPPRGGSSRDYAAWVEEAVGAARVWVFPNWAGVGTVGVTFMFMDGRIPSDDDLYQVRQYLDAYRPVTAQVALFAPQPVTLDLFIRLTPNTVAVQNAVLAELNDLLLRDAVPGGTILISRLREAVSIATGVLDNAIIAVSTSTWESGTSWPDGSDIILDPASVAVLGEVSWTA